MEVSLFLYFIINSLCIAYIKQKLYMKNDYSIISILGNKQINIHNEFSVIEATENIIVIKDKTHIISITGRDFTIDFYEKEYFQLSGYIENIGFKELSQ